MSSCNSISEMLTLLSERFAGRSVIRMWFWCAECGVTQEKAVPSGAVATATMLRKTRPATLRALVSTCPMTCRARE